MEVLQYKNYSQNYTYIKIYNIQGEHKVFP